jgi:cytochrome c553
MKKIAPLMAASALLASGTAFAAGGGVPQICIGCHTASGESVIPEYPKLNGQNAAYLEKALRDYKTDTRMDPTGNMNNFAKYLTDEEIRAASKFYSEQ